MLDTSTGATTVQVVLSPLPPQQTKPTITGAAFNAAQVAPGAQVTLTATVKAGVPTDPLSDETILVDESVALITSHLGLAPEIEHTGGSRGWTGDSPLIHLDTARIRALGWTPEVTIREALVRTLDWLSQSEYAWRERLAYCGAR